MDVTTLDRAPTKDTAMDMTPLVLRPIGPVPKPIAPAKSSDDKRLSHDLPVRAQPSLTFFVELPSDELAQISSPETVTTLARRQAAVSMALLDLDGRRAEVIRQFELAGIAVTAWMLLPLSDGYWLTADNAHLALAQWQRVAQWADREGLRLATVGLDIEPPHDDTVALVQRPVRTAARLLLRRRTQLHMHQAGRHFDALVAAIRHTGRRVEAYHLPFALDDRASGSTLLGQILGTPRFGTDRDVVMLYASAVPKPFGHGLVAAYGPQAQAIAVGITGGGVRSLQPAFAARELAAPQLVTELRTAARHCNDLYVFSLEGCVAKNMVAMVCQADLSPLPADPSAAALATKIARRVLQLALRAATLAEGSDSSTDKI